MTQPSHIPPGYHSISPVISVRDAAKAIEFYKQAFGAEEIMRMTGPNGEIGHAELHIGDSSFSISDENPEWGNLSPQTLGGSPIRISLYVPDVDATVETALKAGAKIVNPISDQFYGERSGRIEDPFGHYWIISTMKFTMPVEEMQRIWDEMSKQGAGD